MHASPTMKYTDSHSFCLDLCERNAQGAALKRERRPFTPVSPLFAVTLYWGGMQGLFSFVDVKC
jgi:hypothetical protein